MAAGLAALYFLAAQLGFLLALLPGNVSVVWIPSGIALASFLFVPRAAIFGIGAGAFAANAWHLGITPAGLAAAAAIAAGSLAQTALAGTLLDRWVLRRVPNEHASLHTGLGVAGSTLRSAAVIVPTSTIAALVGVGALVMAGFAPQKDFTALHLTWWLGDLAGILIVGMPLLSVGRLARGCGRPALLGSVALGLCLFGTGIMCWSLLAKFNRDSYDKALELRVNLLATEISSRLRDEVDHASLVVALLSAEEYVPEPRFSTFAELALDRSGDLSTMSFLPRVTAAQRAHFEQDARSSGHAGFEIWELDPKGRRIRAPQRADYFPVRHIYPMQGNSPALGFNVASDPLRRAALLKSAERRTAISTRPLRAVQDSAGAKSVLVVKPVWRSTRASRDSQEPGNDLIGYSSSVVRLSLLLEKAALVLRDTPRPRAALFFAGGVTDEPEFAAGYGPGLIENEARAWLSQSHARARFSLAGADWLIVLLPQDTRWVSLERIGNTPWLLLVFFFAIGGTTIIYAGIVQRHQARLNLAEKRFGEIAASSLREFAHSTFHELQEPLRAIAGFAQIMETRYRDRLDAKAAEHLGHIVQGAHRMKSLIDAVGKYLDLSGRAAQREAISLEAVLADVLKGLADPIAESGATIRHEALPTLLADHLQMIILFRSLMENALKFRGSGPPEISVTADRLQGAWKVCVRDNGIGIEERYADRIFGIFQRLHDREQFPGLGAGLSLCKLIIAHHGGALWVESAPGKGSAFFFTIPDLLEV